MDATVLPAGLDPEPVEDMPVEYIGRAGVQGQGPFLSLHLHCQDQTVARAWFECHGCPSMLRCGDWVSKWAVGRPVPSLTVLEPGDLEKVVGGLPLGKEFCARLAVEALRDAISQIGAAPHDMGGPLH